MTERTLMLRLTGPLQAWGSGSLFNRRDTGNEPTKSGVIGLLAAAQGRRRSDPIEDLCDLRFGVRTDQPGTVMRDYHTLSTLDGRPLLAAAVDANGRQKRATPAGKRKTAVTERFYLQDACFVAAVRGETALVEMLADAVRRPAFPLCLGRRSCPPSSPPYLELRDDDVMAALAHTPWQAGQRVRDRVRTATVALAYTIDAMGPGDGESHDVPSTFDHVRRRYATRAIEHGFVDVPTGVPDPVPDRLHDPFELLGW